ncbi:MAG: dihydrodipicolinate synthase family protein, partial [Verrucomicrobiota bacterium]|nr:dihydrodipicolinate synthase family protein [Verrucomicrobiota bacterium]
IKANDFESAESIKRKFETLENLRNSYGPIPVLHHAVSLADIAQTGAHLPLMSDLDNDLMDPIKEASLDLFEFDLN